MEPIVKVVSRLRKEEVFELLCRYRDLNFLVRRGTVLDIALFSCLPSVHLHHHGVLPAFLACPASAAVVP